MVLGSRANNTVAKGRAVDVCVCVCVCCTHGEIDVSITTNGSTPAWYEYLSHSRLCFLQIFRAVCTSMRGQQVGIIDSPKGDAWSANEPIDRFPT